MGQHPQLRAMNAPLADFSPAHFFELTLPELLAEHRAEARAVGGRLGFVVGTGEWVVDLDHGRVRGGGQQNAAHDDDGLSALIYVDHDRFARMLAGDASVIQRCDVHEPGALEAFIVFLAGALR